MTKNDLLSMISESTLKCDPDQEKRSLYERYYPLIKATLQFCPDTVELVGLSSIDDFEKRGSFESFVIGNDARTIEKRFEAVLTDLETFANGYVRANPARVQTVATVMSVNNEWQIQRQKKNNVVFIILISLFVIFSAAVFVFALLDTFGVVATGGIISAVCGCLDFANGVAFFIYEQIDDRKKAQIAESAGQAVASGDAKPFIEKSYNIKNVDKSRRSFKAESGSISGENISGTVIIHNTAEKK